MIDGYEICSNGDVYSTKKGTRKKLKPRESSCGYLTLLLYNQGVPKEYTVHQLVASTFLGERPKGYVVDHIDRNRYNNHASNLRYISRSENVKNSRRYGHVPYDKAVRIKAMKPNVRNRKRLAKMYSVSLQTIHNIINGKRKLD